MRYALDYERDVRAYLRGLPLTRAGRLRLNVALADLREIPDSFRMDPVNRDGPNFVFQRIFADGGRWRQLQLVVGDSSAVYGVLRVIYADLA